MMQKNTATLELILLAAIWGGSFLFMRVGSPEFGPILFMTLRTAIASLFLLPLLYFKKQHTCLKKNWGKIFLGSLFNTAIPFVLFGYATLSLSAGVTSILNATTPMFAAVIAFFWFKDRLNISSIIGLMVGFFGVYILMFDKLSTHSELVLMPTLAVLGATFCYGLGANYTKHYLGAIKPLALATGTQITATLALIPFALFYLPEKLPSSDAINAVLMLGVLCTGIAYVIFFRLIANLGPAKAVSVTYLIPAFGLFWGYIFLNEQITSWIIIGCCFILLGVGLTTGVISQFFKPLFNKKQAS
ncbi:MAG: DMT family transporter [Alteromonadaceae bacterium]|nr:DMT family transporter [Alteromonadaceae bacterium]